MMYSFCAKADTGRTRHNNEDAMAFDEQAGIAVMADGMGGYNAGEIASAMAVTSITSALGNWLRDAPAQMGSSVVERAMQTAATQANTAIHEAAHTNPAYAGMGTTLVIGLFRAHQLYIGHIGDSRCYRYRHGALIQITRDHSVLQEQIDAGYITPEQAQKSDIKNLITRALGIDPQVTLEVREYHVEVGDVYLLCTDGLSDMVDSASIARILQTYMGSQQDMAACADALVEAANAAGGRDNISVLLVKASDAPEKSSLFAKLLGQ